MAITTSLLTMTTTQPRVQARTHKASTNRRARPCPASQPSAISPGWRLLDPVAAAPTSSAWSAKSGTGSQDGRPRMLPATHGSSPIFRGSNICLLNTVGGPSGVLASAWGLHFYGPPVISAAIMTVYPTSTTSYFSATSSSIVCASQLKI